MSNVSEAAAENDDRAGGAPAEPETARSSSTTAAAPGDRRAPFDFRLKLDLGGARSPERGLPLFEPRTAPRAAPTFTPIPPPEPLVIEPIALSLDLLTAKAVPEIPLIPTTQLVPTVAPDPQVVARVITEAVPSADPPPADAVEITTSAAAEAIIPVLPKPPARPVVVEPTVAEERVPPAQPTRPTPARRVEVTVVPKHKQKRKRSKGLLVVIVLLGLMAGGGFFFIKQRNAAAARVKEWPTAIKPLAIFVEQTLGTSFAKSVPVTSLPQAEYEAKLGIYELARVPKDGTGGMSGLRALGLVSAAPSAAEVGEYVGTTHTAFYDPATSTVYQVANLTGPFQDANLLSALSVALLDQTKKWGAAMPALSPSQQLGYLSLIEGTGAFVVRTKGLADATFEDAYTTELTDRSTRRDALPTPISPWLVGLFDMPSAQASGIATRALQSGFVGALNAPTSDAAVLDSARGLETPAAAVTSDPSTMGMYMWYGLLYPTLGDKYAFHMASAWTGDSVTYSITDGRGCIRASAATGDVASLNELVNGLNVWAKTRPADTNTQVEAKGTVAVVTACEPAGLVAADSASQLKTDFETRFEQEQVLLQQLSKLSMPLTASAVKCAVNSYRTGGLSDFETEISSLATDNQSTISAELRQSLHDLATVCSSVR
jgi:hypothetical protein